MRSAGQSAALLTGGGRLITGAPAEAAPLGASFIDAPGFAVVRSQMVGYDKLARCDAIVIFSRNDPSASTA